MQLIKDLLAFSVYEPRSGYSAELVDLAEAGYDRPEMLGSWVKKGRTKESFYKALKALKDSLMDFSVLRRSDWSGLRLNRMEVWQKFKTVKLLLIAERNESALRLAVDVIQLAKKAGFAEIVVSLASTLEHHYGAISPDTRRYLRYRKLRKEYALKLQDEMDAKSLQTQLVFHINKKRSVKDLAQEIEALTARKSGTAKYMQNRFAALSVWYDHIGDFDALKKALHETLTFYENCGEMVPDSARWNLYFQCVPLLIREKRFADAAALVSKALETVAPGTHNWHAFLLQRAEIGLASGKPGVALGALRAAEVAPKNYSNREIDRAWERVRWLVGRGN